MSIRDTVSSHTNEVPEVVFKLFLYRLGFCSQRCKGFPILHIKVSENSTVLLFLSFIIGVLGVIKTSSMLAEQPLEESRLTVATE